MYLQMHVTIDGKRGREFEGEWAEVCGRKERD